MCVKIKKVEYGVSKSDLYESVTATHYFTYTANDMCDQSLGDPAGLGGFFEPGFIIQVNITNLKPNTLYFYRYNHQKQTKNTIFFFVMCL